ncbi:hypothetical protein SeLEV6574_g06209 [Synchytrium endobioticum]|uniref:Inositol-1-monophosphatase n=1 Tax=Synchytrium endobioticum TaxID=286115 RepID=A0A507CPZ0_9FUNG|nr:hypothetical protein SeLEV6574_g06209 [Synchytrium endobioticum]
MHIGALRGRVILHAWNKPKNIETKANPQDLVTESDVLVESIVKGILLTKYPDHSFIGEEETSSSTTIAPSSSSRSRYAWIVDPIDGTTNFSHSFPYVAVCIALAVENKPVVGVVYAPILAEIYTAAAGYGSYLNGRRLGVGAPEFTGLASALLLTEFGSVRDLNVMTAKTETIRTLVTHEKIRGVRCLGSAALNICTVASGRGDVYFEAGLRVWDVAAAGIVLQEAGGSAFNYTPENPQDEIDFFVNSVIVVRPMSNPNKAVVMKEVVSRIRSYIRPGLTVGRDHKL